MSRSQTSTAPRASVAARTVPDDARSTGVSASHGAVSRRRINGALLAGDVRLTSRREEGGVTCPAVVAFLGAWSMLATPWEQRATAVPYTAAAAAWSAVARTPGAASPAPTRMDLRGAAVGSMADSAVTCQAVGRRPGGASRRRTNMELRVYAATSTAFLPEDGFTLAALLRKGMETSVAN